MSIFILVLCSVVVLVLLVAAFLPKQYEVVESVIVDASRDETFEFIRHLKNQERYSKWVMLDPDAKRTYSGIDGTIGFIAGWESGNKKLGKGEQEITSMILNERIDVTLRFEKPFKGISPSFFTFEKVDGHKTKVTWGFQSAMPYPMNFMMVAIGLPKLLAADIRESLDNLKNVLQNSSLESISN